MKWNIKKVVQGDLLLGGWLRSNVLLGLVDPMAINSLKAYEHSPYFSYSFLAFVTSSSVIT